jgi:hypothetical protein
VTYFRVTFLKGIYSELKLHVHVVWNEQGIVLVMTLGLRADQD